MEWYAMAAKTLVVYFCFSFGKSEYGKRANHGNAISHKAGYVTSYKMMCNMEFNDVNSSKCAIKILTSKN